MCFLVAFESPQLTEGTVALGTQVGFEHRVSVSLNVEVPAVAKDFVTVLTLERLLLGVGPLVSMQHGVVGELLGAEITAVWLLSCVDSLVNPQVQRLHKPFGTDISFKGSLSRVYPLVKGKLRWIRKSLLAYHIHRVPIPRLLFPREDWLVPLC